VRKWSLKVILASTVGQTRDAPGRRPAAISTPVICGRERGGKVEASRTRGQRDHDVPLES
jgi:hypothetical protein